MKSETSWAASQCRIREWAEQIRDCQNRPEGMKVKDWCKDHGITKANYYYRLRQVRRACLDSIPRETFPGPVVPVKQELLEVEQTDAPCVISSLEIRFKDCVLHVTEATSTSLLEKVVGVIRNAQ